MGAYLSGPAARGYLRGAYGTGRFWCGVGVWAVGFVGNMVHDEILFEIRRRGKAKGKGKQEDSSSSNSSANANGTKEHYAIPHGLLYKYISYPNYLCEWIEWFGFALASCPLPLLPPIPIISSLLPHSLHPLTGTFTWPLFLSTLSPPWIFFLAEVFLMFPRAINGHAWYRQKFGAGYPRERRAVIPWLI